jgi:hypothetical protein
METAKKPVHKKRPWQRIVFAGIVLFASVLMFQETYYRAALSQEELRSSNLFPFIIEKGELPKSVAKRLQKKVFLIHRGSFCDTQKDLAKQKVFRQENSTYTKTLRIKTYQKPLPRRPSRRYR